MAEMSAAEPRAFAEVAHAEGIDRKGLISMRLTVVDRGVGSKVEHDIGLEGREHLEHRSSLSEIELAMADRCHLEAGTVPSRGGAGLEFGDELPADLAARPGDKDTHLYWPV